MTTYNMTSMIIDIVGMPQDDFQFFLVYLVSNCVSLIFVFFVIYIFKVIAGLISPHNYR